MAFTIFPQAKLTKTVLVIGGAGFIGSHMVLSLLHAGYRTIVLDQVDHSFIKSLPSVIFIKGNMADKTLLTQIFYQYSIEAVLHFASYIEVSESVQFPGKYYQNNVAATLTLLETMNQNEIKNIIFSSSAAVYGSPQTEMISETHPLSPINPYGRSKRIVEEMIQDFALSDGLQFAILRYFNAAGADPEARLYEQHQPESHLIPLALQVAMGVRQGLTIYGDQFATRDGTCIRDYIHVMDLCQAHLLALEALLDGKKNFIYNLGLGFGHTVQEVIQIVSDVTGKNLSTLIGRARLGDPAVLVADAGLAKKELNFRPMYMDLETMILHAWSAIKKAGLPVLLNNSS